jgi:uncharacterized protein YjdB
MAYRLVVGLITALTLLIISCSSTTTSTSDLSSITITTSLPAGFEVGSTLQFTAIGTYLSGPTADITSRVTWISSHPDIVTISSTGLATGVAAGSANITAAMSGLTSLPVTLPVLDTMLPRTTTPTTAP